MRKPLFLLPLVMLGACVEPDADESGEELFTAFCAACHGADGTGGEAVAGRVPPDLTTLARRRGGEFPMTYVMSTIDGYARDDTHGPMPRFGDLLEGPVETWEDEDGVLTPTPRALVRLAEYLRGLQV